MATVGDAASNVFVHWKSTVQGIASLVIALSVSAQFMGGLSLKHAAIVMTSAGAAKAIIALLQKDAGIQTALTPSGIEAVPSHETPDSPAAIPVVK